MKLEAPNPHPPAASKAAGHTPMMQRKFFLCREVEKFTPTYTDTYTATSANHRRVGTSLR
jgi:hypothetical protein